MKQFYIYTTDGREERFNTKYPHEIALTTIEAVRDALKNDYTMARYTDNNRKICNFISSNVCPMDCDNTDSDDPTTWKKAEDVKAAFPGVPFWLHYSRNHMKPKGGKEPRPKFHILFLMNEYTDVESYVALKRRVQAYFPDFDPNALDGGRFFYGTQDPIVEYVDGDIMLDDFMKTIPAEAPAVKNKQTAESADNIVFLRPGGKIEEGSRNREMHREAVKVLKHYGNSQESYKQFARTNQLYCNPPLDDTELFTIWRSAVHFYKQSILPSENYEDPITYNGGKLKPARLTELDEAAMFSEYKKGTIAYSDSTNFMAYDGNRWVENEQMVKIFLYNLLNHQDRDVIFNRHSLTKKKMDIEAAQGDQAKLFMLEEHYRSKVIYSEQEIQEYSKFVTLMRKAAGVNSILSLVKPMIMFDVQQLDANVNLLCTPDGTLDLRKGISSLRKNDPADMITKITAVSPFDTEGDQIWQDALNTIFMGKKDLIDYLQLVVGQMAFGEVKNERMTIAYGGGSNGKSTFWNTICHVMGSYGCFFDADILTQESRYNARPQLAELRGMRIAVAGELENNRTLSTSLVKKITSTDNINAEKKYRAPFDFKPSHSCVLYTNHLPDVQALDAGIWRRIHVIPFQATITKADGNENYGAYLEQHAGGAILKWIIDGAKKAYDCNFHYEQPECVRQMIADYRYESDTIARFVSECCIIESSAQESAASLYSSYKEFCEDAGMRPFDVKTFKGCLTAKGYGQKRTKQGMKWTGITLCNPDIAF